MRISELHYITTMEDLTNTEVSERHRPKMSTDAAQHDAGGCPLGWVSRLEGTYGALPGCLIWVSVLWVCSVCESSLRCALSVCAHCCIHIMSLSKSERTLTRRSCSLQRPSRAAWTSKPSLRSPPSLSSPLCPCCTAHAQTS